ncbi:MAG: carbon-nitrogen hydrolase family protein [Deltaproteobacteria bacterium]|nr:carbon-nitrogen hydrolase family protein [Deltaproteobacteria bacterium]
MTLAAVVQLSCTSDEDRNLSTAESLIRRAAGLGATLVSTPENTNYLGPHGEKVRRAQPLDGPLVGRFTALARELGITLVVGSVNEASSEATRCHNTSVLIGPDGGILASYRKIHLFDVDVDDDVRFQESATCVPGDRVVVADSPVGRVGLSVCYDLRFPMLYQRQVEMGAEILTIPAAFTATTGKDHWEPLIRARAIETQCYVLAAGQSGRHDDQGLRASHGHSMIVDPWGHVVARASDGPGIALAEIDLERVAKIRRAMPVQSHRRPLGLPETP